MSTSKFKAPLRAKTTTGTQSPAVQNNGNVKKTQESNSKKKVSTSTNGHAQSNSNVQDIPKTTPGTTSGPRPQPGTSKATTSGTQPSKKTAKKLVPKLRAPNLNKPKDYKLTVKPKPERSLNNEEYESIFQKVLNPSPLKSIPEVQGDDVSEGDFDISDSDVNVPVDVTGIEAEEDEARKPKLTLEKETKSTRFAESKVDDLISDISESDFKNSDDDAAPFRGFIPEDAKAETKPSTSGRPSSGGLPSRRPTLPPHRLTFDEVASAENSEEWDFPVSRNSDVPSTPANMRAAKRILDYDETPVSRNPRKKTKKIQNTADEDKENEGVSTGTDAETDKRSSSSSYKSANSDVERQPPLSNKTNTPPSSSILSKDDAERPMPFDYIYPNALPPNPKAPKPSTFRRPKFIHSITPSTKSAKRPQKFSTPQEPALSQSSEYTIAYTQELSASQEPALSQASEYSIASSQKLSASQESAALSQESVYSIASSQLDTEGTLAWLLPRRMVGTWVQCDGCKKWRYIRDIHDPTVFPNRWYCNLNLDVTRNTCEAEIMRIPLKDEALMIFNAYAPGSIVWAHVDGYPWWPAIVDDDPDYLQFYWFDGGATEIPTQYHVVFFDKRPSRAWIISSNLRPFKKGKSQAEERNVKTWNSRLKFAIREAEKAYEIVQEERLRTYGMLALLKRKLIVSSNKNANKSPVSEASDSDGRSDVY